MCILPEDKCSHHSYIFFHKYLSTYPLLKVPHHILCYQRKWTRFFLILFIYMYNKTNTQSFTVIFIPMTIQTHVGHCLNILHKESPGGSFDVRVPAGPTCLTVSVPGSHPSGGISHVAPPPPSTLYGLDWSHHVDFWSGFLGYKFKVINLNFDLKLISYQCI